MAAQSGPRGELASNHSLYFFLEMNWHVKRGNTRFESRPGSEAAAAIAQVRSARCCSCSLLEKWPCPKPATRGGRIVPIGCICTLLALFMTWRMPGMLLGRWMAQQSSNMPCRAALRIHVCGAVREKTAKLLHTCAVVYRVSYQQETKHGAHFAKREGKGQGTGGQGAGVSAAR